jgi:hypothetical protein
MSFFDHPRPSFGSPVLDLLKIVSKESGRIPHMAYFPLPGPISSQPRIPNQDGVSAWIELSVDPSRPTKIHAHGQYSETYNPTLNKVLVVIDELEHRGRTNADN